MSESKTVAVPISIPVLLPGDEVVNQFVGKLPETIQFLIDHEYLTHEEAVAFLQFRVTISEIANSTDEFLAIYRNVKQELARKESGIILPTGY